MGFETQGECRKLHSTMWRGRGSFTEVRVAKELRNDVTESLSTQRFSGYIVGIIPFFIYSVALLPAEFPQPFLLSYSSVSIPSRW